MSEARHETQDGVEETADFLDALDTLRNAGADRFDPVRFHYLNVLAGRVSEQQGAAKAILTKRLTDELASYRQRFTTAQRVAQALAKRLTAQHPDSADELQQRVASGDFRGVQGLAATLDAGGTSTPLAGLIRYIEHHAPEHAGNGGAASSVPRSELKSLRYFRNTWSKLSVDKQVAQAMEQAPENAGPLNSQHLVLRSLALMRDTSPDYLNRFMSYVDTLLCLDQAIKDSRPAAKKPVKATTKKKTKADSKNPD